jgi:hypothetical protein
MDMDTDSTATIRITGGEDTALPLTLKSERRQEHKNAEICIFETPVLWWRIQSFKDD